MTTTIMVRCILGGFFIIYGLILSVYEKFKGIKYMDQINGVINGFALLVVGTVLFSYKLQMGLIVGGISLTLWLLIQIITKHYLKKK